MVATHGACERLIARHTSNLASKNNASIVSRIEIASTAVNAAIAITANVHPSPTAAWATKTVVNPNDVGMFPANPMVNVALGANSSNSIIKRALQIAQKRTS